jgi:hypothetical protein
MSAASVCATPLSAACVRLQHARLHGQPLFGWFTRAWLHSEAAFPSLLPLLSVCAAWRCECVCSHMTEQKQAPPRPANRASLALHGQPQTVYQVQQIRPSPSALAEALFCHCSNSEQGEWPELSEDFSLTEAGGGKDGEYVKNWVSGILLPQLQAQWKIDAKDPAAARWDLQSAQLKALASGTEQQRQEFASALLQLKWHAFSQAALEAVAFASGVRIQLYDLMVHPQGIATVVMTTLFGAVGAAAPGPTYHLLASVREHEWDILVSVS